MDKQTKTTIKTLFVINWHLLHGICLCDAGFNFITIALCFRLQIPYVIYLQMLLLSDLIQRKADHQNRVLTILIGCAPFNTHVFPRHLQHKMITSFCKVTSMAGD